MEPGRELPWARAIGEGCSQRRMLKLGLEGDELSGWAQPRVGPVNLCLLRSLLSTPLPC